MRKMAVYLGLVEDEDQEFYDEDGYDEPSGTVARRGDSPAPLRVTRPDETAVSYTPPRQAATAAVDDVALWPIRAPNAVLVLLKLSRSALPVSTGICPIASRPVRRCRREAVGSWSARGTGSAGRKPTRRRHS